MSSSSLGHCGHYINDHCGEYPHDQLDAINISKSVLLDQIQQLIINLLLHDIRHKLTCHETEPSPSFQRASPNVSTKFTASAPDALIAQELEKKLAIVLLELAEEQQNLRIAATAGKALLEELQRARDEIDTLQRELECTQDDRDRAIRQAVRLQDVAARYEKTWLFDDEPREDGRIRPLDSKLSSSFGEIYPCQRCQSQEVERVQQGHRLDESRRYCMELEVTHERDQQRERELTDHVALLRQRFQEQIVETFHAKEHLESVVIELQAQTYEIERVQAERDSFRDTIRRLNAEKEELRKQVTKQDERIQQSEKASARVATQLQVATNRAQAESKRVSELLQLIETHLESAKERCTCTESGSETQEHELRAMEQLLQDAIHQVTALRRQNQLLRRQKSMKMDSSTASTQIITQETESMALTAADVLAHGTTGSVKGDITVHRIATCESNRKRASQHLIQRRKRVYGFVMEDISMTSRLYLGLPLIACAMAATAAGLRIRR